MNKVTYLFGAGASVHALPIVEQIPQRIKELIEFLEEEEFKLDESSTFSSVDNSKSKREYQLEMIDLLKWMMEKSKNHASIDTFAKKLYLKSEEDELHKLKIAMSIFFTVEQVRVKPDYRYDSFFASIFNNLYSFPENIKIISWNYDSQFEISYAEYSGSHEINRNQSILNITEKYDYKSGNNGFGIYKLNGTTGTLDNEWRRTYPYLTNLRIPIDKNFVSDLTNRYARIIYYRSQSTLSFAWEGNDKDDSFINNVILNTNDTVALVVIGYSFPFFNRDIDRKIIGSMKNLKRVYFQAPDADNLKERFQALRDDLEGIELVCKFDCNQFLLPNEL